MVEDAARRERLKLSETKEARSKRRMAKRRAQTLPDTETMRAMFATRLPPADQSDLAAYAHKVLSQRGEDGMVHAILSRAGFPTRRSVEIGCGSNGGNSGLLAACFDYRALMVDGNEELVEIAEHRFAERDVTVVRAWITAETVDDLIREHGFAGCVDHFGLELDGVDYWVWRAMTACDPLLIVAEYNPLFGPDVAVTVEYDPEFDRHTRAKSYWGASLAGLAALARGRGYRLVATSPGGTSNAFFVRDGECPEFPERTVREVFRPPVKGRQPEMFERAQRVGVLRYFEQLGAPLVVVNDLRA
jgi:hypothetical protein